MKGVESHSAKEKEMETAYFEHPTEEALERFLLSHASQEESETVETHFLACSACVSRLETLETQIVILKTALSAYELERKEKQAAKAARVNSWRNWFTIPKLSFAGAGAFAALAVGTFVIPQFAAQDITLTPNRGTDVQVAPQHRALRLHLNAPNAADGPVSIELLEVDGTRLWNGRAVVHHNQANVVIPGLKESGSHFVRLSRSDNGNEEGILQEYSLDVK
jgi:hypothetical protein